MVTKENRHKTERKSVFSLGALKKLLIKPSKLNIFPKPITYSERELNGLQDTTENEKLIFLTKIVIPEWGGALKRLREKFKIRTDIHFFLEKHRKGREKNVEAHNFF